MVKKLKKENCKEDDDGDSTIAKIEEQISKIFRLNKIEEKENGVKYEINFWKIKKNKNSLNSLLIKIKINLK